MLPIVYHRRTEGTGNGPIYLDYVGWRQKKPYNLVLEFDGREAYLSQSGENPWLRPTGSIASLVYDFMAAGQARTDNRTYSRFIGKLHGQDADLGIVLGEHESARKMLTNRSRQMLTLASAVVRRDFSAARKLCPPRRSSKPLKVHKDIAGNWLEWSWGWRPMVEDISNALETLVSPVLYQTIKASTTSDHLLDLNDYHFDGLGYAGRRSKVDYVENAKIRYRCATGAKCAIDNPNVALANRLGLINLPGIYWAVQPFSFVVDKYVNVGQMIGSLYDLYGFTIVESWTSRSARIDGSGFYRSKEWDRESGYVYFERDDRAVYWGKAKRRAHGLLKPVLTTRLPTIGSFGEAASYMALLVQLLSK